MSGDIVTLHSGGPDLTILRVRNGDADLGWFTAAGEYRTGTLPLTVLRTRSRNERDSGSPEHLLDTADADDHGMLVASHNGSDLPGVGAVRGVDAGSVVLRSVAHAHQRNDTPRSAQVATPAKPPRTGYRDYATGIHHPGPSYVGFDQHADGCQSCAALRLIADDYIDRRGDERDAFVFRRSADGIGS